MRKLLLAIGFFGLAASSQAAFVQCTPDQAATIVSGVAVPGGVPFTCGPVGVDGDDIFITSLQLQVSGTASTNSGAVGTVGSAFTILSTSLPSPQYDAFVGTTCTASGVANDLGQAGGLCSQFSAIIGAGGVDSIPSFTITIGSSDPDNGGPVTLAFQGSASAFYQAEFQNAVPEPSSMALLGSSLIGLGLIARRRRKQ